jgi:hypothetical protein
MSDIRVSPFQVDDGPEWTRRVYWVASAEVPRSFRTRKVTGRGNDPAEAIKDLWKNVGRAFLEVMASERLRSAESTTPDSERPVIDGDPVRGPIWEAINSYTNACGGDTGADNVSDARMDAVIAVALELDRLSAAEKFVDRVLEAWQVEFEGPLGLARQEYLGSLQGGPR